MDFQLGRQMRLAVPLLIFMVFLSTPLARAQPPEAAEIPDFGANLLRDSLESNFNGYTNNVWGTITAVLIAVGWLLTSEKSRIFLSKKSPCAMGGNRRRCCHSDHPLPYPR